MYVQLITRIKVIDYGFFFFGINNSVSIIRAISLKKSAERNRLWVHSLHEPSVSSRRLHAVLAWHQQMLVVVWWPECTIYKVCHYLFDTCFTCWASNSKLSSWQTMYTTGLDLTEIELCYHVAIRGINRFANCIKCTKTKNVEIKIKYWVNFNQTSREIT